MSNKRKSKSKENQKKRNIKSRKIDKRKRKMLVSKCTITLGSAYEGEKVIHGLGWMWLEQNVTVALVTKLIVLDFKKVGKYLYIC